MAEKKKSKWLEREFLITVLMNVFGLAVAFGWIDLDTAKDLATHIADMQGELILLVTNGMYILSRGIRKIGTERK